MPSVPELSSISRSRIPIIEHAVNRVDDSASYLNTGSNPFCYTACKDGLRFCILQNFRRLYMFSPPITNFATYVFPVYSVTSKYIPFVFIDQS